MFTFQPPYSTSTRQGVKVLISCFYSRSQIGCGKAYQKAYPNFVFQKQPLS